MVEGQGEGTVGVVGEDGGEEEVGAAEDVAAVEAVVGAAVVGMAGDTAIGEKKETVGGTAIGERKETVGETVIGEKGEKKEAAQRHGKTIDGRNRRRTKNGGCGYFKHLVDKVGSVAVQATINALLYIAQIQG